MYLYVSKQRSCACLKNQITRCFYKVKAGVRLIVEKVIHDKIDSAQKTSVLFYLGI